MAITQAMKDLVRPVDDGSMNGGTDVGRGLVKTGSGELVIARPTTGFSRTGPLSESVTGDVAMKRDTQDYRPSADATQRRRKRRDEAVQPQQKALQTVKVTVEGLGTVPSQYVKFLVGPNAVVLGMCDLSYEPPKSRVDGSRLLGAVMFEGRARGRYVNGGYEVTDTDGTRLLILFRVPDEEVRDEEDEQ